MEIQPLANPSYGTVTTMTIAPKEVFVLHSKLQAKITKFFGVYRHSSSSHCLQGIKVCLECCKKLFIQLHCTLIKPERIITNLIRN